MRTNLLIVDDEKMIRDLLQSTLEREGYVCFQASDADSGFSVINDQQIDLALLDIMMPGRSGVDLLQQIKTISPDTVVIMVTALSDMDTALACVHMGSDDYILKPFNIDRIILTIKNSLEKRRLTLENRDYQINLEKKVLAQTEQIRNAMAEINQAYEHTLTALVRALDAREREIGSHSERVMAYTMLLAKTAGVTEPDLSIMAKGALLHDIGKIGVSDNILLKPGKLDAGEWIEMKKHPTVGFDILSDIKYLKGAAEFVLAHHERYDGTGYPRGLKGNDIPICSRIFALVDTLDAMTSDRPYRKALTFEEVTHEVIKCSGTQFDPKMVKIFLEIPRIYWEEMAKTNFRTWPITA